MKRLLLITILFLQVSSLLAQEKPTSQTNYSLDFATFLSGVEYAQMVPSERVSGYINSESFKGYMGNAVMGIKNYIEAMGFTIILNNTTYNIKSQCDIVNIVFDFEFVYISWDNKYFKNISYTFITCNNDKFVFNSYKTINYSNFDNQTDFYNSFLNCYKYKKPSYSSYNKLKLKRNSTSWSENKLKENWKKNGIDQLEGIYEKSSASTNQPRYKVGLVKTSDGYNLIYLSGAVYTNDWDEGELKATLIPTATSNLFKTKWYMANKTINEEWYMSFEQGIINLLTDGTKELYIKMYPTANDNLKPKGASGTGTGVAIASNGLIVTNYHVIDGANTINVKGINGDFSKSYIAKVLTFDEKNDLAIIKIDDVSFSTLGTPPFSIKSVTSEVGSDIFVLGYPLTATMGDEIKLTNGIISAKSGFQGDITSYQMTAPIQPGNSGAPLFDKNGYLIGIVNAKHLGAENAGYAIKSSYLNNLIESLTPIPKLTTQNLLIGKPLTEQVKLIKKFVYIIEVN